MNPVTGVQRGDRTPETFGGLAPAARLARTRLLILVTDFEAHGAVPALLRAVPRLAGQRFEITVAGLGPWGPAADRLEAGGARAVALGATRAVDPRVAGRLLSIFRRDRIQVVHAFEFRPALHARLLGRAAGVPVVVTTFEPGQVWGPWRRVLDRATAALSDAVVVRTDAERRAAVEEHGHAPGRIHRIRPAADPETTPPPPKTRDHLRREFGAFPGDLLVGCAARLQDDGARGAALFLAAARSVAARETRSRFVVLGDGPGRPALERRAAREGVSHCTTFAGARDFGEAVHCLDLFVQPGGGGAAIETLLQALAAGVPAVAVRSGGLEEIAGDGEGLILASPSDPEGIARACAGLLGDREGAARVAVAGRARVAGGFGLEEMIGDAVAMYRALLRGRQESAHGRDARGTQGGASW